MQHSWDGIAFDLRHLDTVYSKCNLLRFSDYNVDSISFFFHIFNNRRALLCPGLCSSETYHYCMDGNWDGTCQGQPCSAGAYVYLVKHAEAGNPANHKMVKGTVLLIR